MRNIFSRERSTSCNVVQSGVFYDLFDRYQPLADVSTSRACFGWNRRVFVVVADDDPISWPIIIFVDDMTSCPKMEIFSF
jgi:hypothetical protein